MVLPTSVGRHNSEKSERSKLSPQTVALQKKKPSVIYRSAGEPNHKPFQT